MGPILASVAPASTLAPPLTLRTYVPARGGPPYAPLCLAGMVMEPMVGRETGKSFCGSASLPPCPLPEEILVYSTRYRERKGERSMAGA
jgi:hypothetical protein